MLVFGAGISGIGAARLLEEHQAEVILYDGNQKLDEEEMKEQLGRDTVTSGCCWENFRKRSLETLDMAVLSPGRSDRSSGGPAIWSPEDSRSSGEIELAYEFGKGDVLAITGTNGKTTTTALLGEIMKQCKK